jgi:hypothetical protein
MINLINLINKSRDAQRVKKLCDAQIRFLSERALPH